MEVKAKLKDLFKAVQNEVIFINRLGDKLSDRNEMVTHFWDALVMISEYEEENGLTKDMKRFLKHRVYQATRNTGILEKCNHNETFF